MLVGEGRSRLGRSRATALGVPPKSKIQDINGGFRILRLSKRALVLPQCFATIKNEDLGDSLKNYIIYPI